MSCPFDNMPVGTIESHIMREHLCEVCGAVFDRADTIKYLGIEIRQGTPTHIFLSLNGFNCPECGNDISQVNVPCGGVRSSLFEQAKIAIENYATDR